MKNLISFGTSGHRGVIDHSFTHLHVRAIAQAIATLLHEENETNPTVVIGYDPRTGNDPNLSESSFTKTLVDTLLESGISVQFCENFTPTPIISFTIPFQGLSGGMMLTASHNPPEYNGLKFNTKNGAPAPVAITQKIEKLGNNFLTSPPQWNKKKGQLSRISPTKQFVSHCQQILGAYFKKELTFSQSIIGIDVKFGACTETWEALLSELGQPKSVILNKDPRSDFGNTNPNPIEKELNALKQWVLENKADMGIGNDPDGDRHAILDETGNWVSPEETTVIIAEYLKKAGYPINGIASTCASSQLVQSWCQKNQTDYYETAVGFKYFTPYLEQAKHENTLVLAVESSGGFSFSPHTLEKCGFLPGLLLLAIISETKTPLSHLKAAILNTYGTFLFREESLQISAEKKESILRFLKNPNQDQLKKHYPNIHTVSTLDGLKIVLKNKCWVLVRASGTEPLLRLYSESSSKEESQHLLHPVKALLNEI